MHFRHRPLEAYFAAMTAAGLLVESLAEPCPVVSLGTMNAAEARRRRVPSFVHIRALKPA